MARRPVEKPLELIQVTGSPKIQLKKDKLGVLKLAYKYFRLKKASTQTNGHLGSYYEYKIRRRKKEQRGSEFRRDIGY